MSTWTPGFDEGDSVSREQAEWEEHWNVIGFEPPVGVPAWSLLLAEQPGLAPGAQHPNVFGAYVDGFSADRIAPGAPAWDVKVSYKRSADRNAQLDLPPAQRPSIITATHESVEVPTLRKQNGDPWINTAGDLIAGHTRKENHWVFRVEKNVATIPAWFMSYADAVNSDAVTIKGLSVAAEYLLLAEPQIPMNPSYETVNEIEYQFYPLAFSLLYNPRTWKTELYNRGLYEYVWPGTPGTGTPEKKRILDDDGEPIDEPQFLDADGQRLTEPVDPGDIVILDGWDHELLPFNALPLT